MIHQASINSSHQTAYTYLAKSSKVLRNSLLRRRIIQMWILKNSKELLEHLKSPIFNHETSITSFVLFTHYSTIPRQKLKNRLTTIIRNAFMFINGNRRYNYLVHVLGYKETIFVKEHSYSKNKYSEDDIVKVTEFLVKVSGATASWPFTDSAVPSTLLLRSAGLQPAGLLLILLSLCIIIKVSGATVSWPLTDSDVPSSLLLRSAGLQPADLLLILLFLPHYY